MLARQKGELDEENTLLSTDNNESARKAGAVTGPGNLLVDSCHQRASNLLDTCTTVGLGNL